MLGMYVHTHWAYGHPYAARSWTLADWQGYLAGLQALGYDFILLWPQLDCMPPLPNASDQAYLAKIAQVIDLAHTRCGMRFAITAAPNTIGNARSPAYAFEQRPYFVCEQKVNPGDAQAVADFLAGRRRQLAPLAHADAFFMIDSDPGGYIGSTNDEFVTLMKAQLDILRETNPAMEMVYWMWVGWENYNAFWASAVHQKPGDPDPQIDWNIKDFLATLPLMQARIPEPWSVTASMPAHLQATRALGLGHKRLFFPYGLIEGEPTYPLTNYAPHALAERLSGYTPAIYPHGVLANSQTHCMQLPGAYLFAHFAQGGTLETLDLEGFAAQVIPTSAGVVTRAWELVESGDAAAQHATAKAVRDEIGKPHGSGKASGLLFGDVDRFLADLAANLEIRAGLLELRESVDAQRDVKGALRNLLAQLLPYQERVGFIDAYFGPLRDGLNEQVARLGEPSLMAIVNDFANWREPAVRNGVAKRLFEALALYAS
ncbi:MAG TPA: hypothetical protein VGK81_04100 [Anaerolineae bacterium]